MTSAEAVRFLYGLERFGIKAGLRNISLLLASLDHPESAYPSIHVAGTNGKGSTSSILASVLSASGFRTGLYTSPHLIDFTERIRIDGVPISPRRLAAYTERIHPLVRKLRATFFEATTAIAFAWFADEEVDCAVIETGLGGRLDATNVVRPAVSVITTIGLDHMEHLGRTPSAILREKAGIVKTGIPVVSGIRQPDLQIRLERIAAERHAPCFRAGGEAECRIVSASFGGSEIAVRSRKWNLSRVFLRLPGDYQAENLRNAVAALAHLPDVLRRRITADAIRRGCASLPARTGLRGRLELIAGEPPTVIDVGHNPDGIGTAVASFRKLAPSPWLVVFGVMRDKDAGSMARLLAPAARLVIAVEPQTTRALGSHKVAEAVWSAGGRAIAAGTVENGLRLARAERRRGEPLLLIGSHYLAGEALKFFQENRLT